FDDAAAKALTGWLPHGGAAAFAPAEDQAIRSLAPLEIDVALGFGQSAVFDRVGGEFVQRDGDGLGGVRLQDRRRAVDAHPALVLLEIRGKLLVGDRR